MAPPGRGARTHSRRPACRAPSASPFEERAGWLRCEARCPRATSRAGGLGCQESGPEAGAWLSSLSLSCGSLKPLVVPTRVGPTGWYVGFQPPCFLSGRSSRRMSHLGRGGGGRPRRWDTSLTRGLRATRESRKVSKGWGPQRAADAPCSRRRGVQPQEPLKGPTPRRVGHKSRAWLLCTFFTGNTQAALDTGLGQVTTPERSGRGESPWDADGRSSSSPARDCARPGTPPGVRLGFGNHQVNENRG